MERDLTMHTGAVAAAYLALVKRFTVGSDSAYLMVPKYQQTLTRHLVLHTHAMGEPSVDFCATDPRQRPVTSALLAAGYVVAASTAAGDNWGNQAALDAYAALHAAIGDLGYTLDKTVLLGVSMGGIPALLSYAGGVIPRVAGFIGICPAASLAAAWSNGALTTAIRTAYGIAGDGSDYASKTAGHDPMLFAVPTWNDKRLLMFASNEDTTTLKASHADALAARATGATVAEVVTCSGAHGDADQYRAAAVLAAVDAWTAVA